MLNDEEFKKRWIKALRSGKYKQVQKALRIDNAFCCLGVACDISGTGTWRSSKQEVKSYFVLNDGSYPSQNMLPESVADSLGVTQAVWIPKLLDRHDKKCNLAELNDSDFTFDQIADIIEYFL